MSFSKAAKSNHIYFYTGEEDEEELPEKSNNNNNINGSGSSGHIPSASNTVDNKADIDEAYVVVKHFHLSSNPASSLLKRRNKPQNGQHVKLMVSFVYGSVSV